MRRLILLAVAIIGSTALFAQEFDTHFEDATLRIDYTFAGNAKEQFVALDNISKSDGWWGRRINLDNVPLRGNGDLTLYDKESGTKLYTTSFSSLFQEWITTPEAAEVTRSFEFTLLVPKPRTAVVAEIVLRTNTGAVGATLRHVVDPEDVLIRDLSKQEPLPYSYVHKGGDSKECIDVVILAEGYTAQEMSTFMED
ncbi:MAG: peptidase M64, partial [Alistipes sp.]|nr:peptidase M64 [Alistipes sp.]